MPLCLSETCISIHALREEGDGAGLRKSSDTPISIHALREEGDFMDDLKAICQQDFNPRPPRGGRPHKRELAYTAA